jgi:hypothetical protein
MWTGLELRTPQDVFVSEVIRPRSILVVALRRPLESSFLTLHEDLQNRYLR